MKDPKAIRKAILTAKSLARMVDPSFGRVPLPDLGGFGSDKAVEEHSPMVHAMYGEPLPQHFDEGGRVPNLYSHAAETVQQHPQAQIPSDELRTWLGKRGVSPEEMRWSGYNEAYPSGSVVDREKAAQMFTRNIPELHKEVRYKDPRLTEALRDIDEEYAPMQDLRRRSVDMRERAIAENDENLLMESYLLQKQYEQMGKEHHKKREQAREPYARPSHDVYEEYTVPGGKNYRETILSLPHDSRHVLMRPDYEEEMGAPPEYTHGHWEGTSNPVGHIRTKERESEAGEPFLSTEEAQSDWGQEGRKEGFFDPEAQKKSRELRAELEKKYADKLYEAFLARGDDPAEARKLADGPWYKSVQDMAKYVGDDTYNKRQAALRDAQLSDIPAGPWVQDEKAFTALAARTLLQEAREKGLGAIGIAPPEEISLKNGHAFHLQNAMWFPNEVEEGKEPTGNLMLHTNDGDMLGGPTADAAGRKYSNIRASDLKYHLGHEAAAKLLAKGPQNQLGMHEITSDEHPGLFGGGKGHVKNMQYYGQTLPKMLLKLAREFDPSAHSEVVHTQIPETEEPGVHGYRKPFQLIRFNEEQNPERMRAFAGGGEVDHASNGGSQIDPAIYREVLRKIHSPLSENPESVKRALEIAATYRHPIGAETGVGSFYNIKQSMPARDVRSTIEDIPGIPLKKEKKGSWEDFYKRGKGGVFINMGGDLSNFGRLTHINDKKLAWPVDLHAGTKFMLEPNPGHVWANAAGHSTAFENKIRAAEKAGHEVFGMFSPMGPRAVDSSHHMFDALMAQVPGSGVSKKDLHAFDADLKEGKHLDAKIKKDPKKLKAHLDAIQAWPGLENAKEASEFARNLSGGHRGLIVQYMEGSKWRDMGMPEVGITRAAITDPELKGIGGNKIGHRVVKLSSTPIEGSRRAFEHNTYPTYTSGEYVMDVPAIQRHYAAPDVIERMVMNPTRSGQMVHPYSEEHLGRSTSRKLFEEQKQVQPINQRMLDSAMLGMESQEKYGFKKGGTVRKALMIAKGGKKK